MQGPYNIKFKKLVLGSKSRYSHQICWSVACYLCFCQKDFSVTIFSKYFSVFSETSNNRTYIVPNDDRLLFNDQDSKTVTH
jgi:hypothetical protein